MLRIFGRDVWLPQAEPGSSALTVTLAMTAARVRVVARWNTPAAATLQAGFCGEHGNTGPRPLTFFPFGNGLFTRWETSNSGEQKVELSSPCPPDWMEFNELAIPAVSITSDALPACLEASTPQPWNEPAGLDFVSLVTAKLSDGDMSGAIRLFTYSRCGIPEAEVTAAAREVLAHLARYPLRRDPLLGAFLAALCTEAAAR